VFDERGPDQMLKHGCSYLCTTYCILYYFKTSVENTYSAHMI